jgi:integrase
VEQDIIPSRLGEMRLTDIRRSHVNAWVADLTAAGRGAVTVRRALATLRMIFSTAVRDEIIPANPAIMIDKPAVPNEDAPVKVWEPAYTKEFFERCSRHRLGALFEETADTGLRRGEITGLHWADVDLDNRIIVVRHNRVSVDGRVQSKPPLKPAQEGAQCRSATLGRQP